jgi:putative ABC transport system ATP-binding protein
MNVIEVRDLHKIYDAGPIRTHVLRGLNFSVRKGEFVAIMGKSGAGKSTLLHQLSFLDAPTRGIIQYEGRDTTSYSKKESSLFRLFTLGYIFQDYALLPELDALENVLLPLLMRGMDWQAARAIAVRALDSVGLSGKYANVPAQLSGGEQQRVSVARAIAGKPKIIFADEPTANLDSVSGQVIIDLLAELHRDGQTIVLVTHEAEYARDCDRIVFLEDGCIVHEETRIQQAENLSI